jgi:hypothetical protein
MKLHPFPSSYRRLVQPGSVPLACKRIPKVRIVQVLFESSAVLSQGASNRSTRENGTFGNHTVPKMKDRLFWDNNVRFRTMWHCPDERKYCVCRQSSYDAERSKCHDYVELRSGPSRQLKVHVALIQGLPFASWQVSARVKTYERHRRRLAVTHYANGRSGHGATWL